MSCEQCAHFKDELLKLQIRVAEQLNQIDGLKDALIAKEALTTNFPLKEGEHYKVVRVKKLQYQRLISIEDEDV